MFQTKDKTVSVDADQSYWQLLQMIFSGLYLESGTENAYLTNFFSVEIKVDVLLLRMVLDIIGKTLRQVDPSAEAFERSDFLQNSKIFS